MTNAITSKEKFMKVNYIITNKFRNDDLHIIERNINQKLANVINYIEKRKWFEISSRCMTICYGIILVP